ncbi:MarR family winged helix-turn-helix transcriptional regulator [Solicola gregarius]|uniref:MarR family transcriptional regulator n=1 Tax=Solicola gregarius TaxID=2908642 RepID=A0AA46TIC1_9ACTN|nr:MarR family transcriptional regulator [Solicola gregarius]UYM05887.1 MarR family transcriptional regulator [Solicola gregarius]
MTEPRWLNAEEHDAWIRLVAVTLLLPSALDNQLSRDAGLTHFGYLVLAMLSESEGRTLPMSTLASYTNASLSRLSHVVARLECNDWVVREPSADDRRVTMARLTEAGHAKIVDTAPGHVEHVRNVVFDALSPEQVRQLEQIAADVLCRLDPDKRNVATR